MKYFSLLILFVGLLNSSQANPVYGVLYVHCGDPEDIGSIASMKQLVMNLNAGIPNNAYAYKLIEEDTFGQAQAVFLNPGPTATTSIDIVVYHGLTDENHVYHGMVKDNDPAYPNGHFEEDIDKLFPNAFAHCGYAGCISADQIGARLANKHGGGYSSGSSGSGSASAPPGASANGSWVAITQSGQYGYFRDDGTLVVCYWTSTSYVWVVTPGNGGKNYAFRPQERTPQSNGILLGNEVVFT